ncbi:MAG: hypothetical protein A2750_02750 [Candidatus Yanofskybacteria bacterium RIFCSPHIGHO2_01_FULL_45_42]|uniref:NYN domain-containing protein n=1 Tax=Candidatus Yanofskybacteria bacterium RIFCSPHIGHO2_01_FULL_45_42 TaxID=1802671 RepID=A0A1F8F1K4_9BACT|nr:MAG: hypothetical protein A2750_02750 [Candidatus Yanofskybacteria bacterium RIFCSPHIGHO2_01_FULL_45_42]
MDLQEFKKQQIKEQLGIRADFGTIHAFIDFANVNHWFEYDDQNVDGDPLPADQRLSIDLQKLHDFLGLFSGDIRFYYGHDPAKPGSIGFHRVSKYVFGQSRVFTKPLQKIKHYLNPAELAATAGLVNIDKLGSYIIIPKSNFDVEITLDAIRLAERYDTFCLLSGDADFAPLLRYLKGSGKKTILVKGGYIQDTLKQASDITINAQDIKQHIAMEKQKPGS